MIVSLRRVLPCLAAIAVAISTGTLAASQTVGPQSLPASDPRALVAQGQALLKQGNRTEADRVLKAAIEAANQSNLDPGDRDRAIGGAALLLADMRQQANGDGEAAEYFQQALTSFERLNDDAGIARALAGLVWNRRDPFEKEETLLQRALPRARAAGLREVEADILHLWGDGLFTDGQYERAYSMLLEAESVAKETDDLDELGTIYNSIGRLYRNHGRLETALEYQLKALRLHEKLPRSFVLMQSLNAVGVTYQAMGDYANGRLYLNRALESAVATSSPRVQDFIRANLVDSLVEEGAYAETAQMLEGVIERKLDNYPQLRYAQLADVYRAMGRLDSALSAADRSIELCGEKQENSFCVLAFDIRAQVHLASGNRAGARADLNAALAMLERIRARLVPNDFFRQNFGRSQQRAYSRAIEIQIADGHVREALETAELARSRAFVDLLAGRDVTLLEGARSAPAATVADLTRVANRLGSTLVMYWVTPTRLFIWTVSPGGNVRSATVAIRESRLAELVRSTAPVTGTGRAPMIATLRARGEAELAIAKADAKIWHELYDVLLRPVRDSLPQAPGALVTIVPHGPLSMLSFAALQDDKDRYLIEDFTLNYVPAGAVLDFTAARRRADARSSDTLVVADPSYHRKSTLDPVLPALPGSRIEARSIARLSAKDRVTLLEGDEATERRVRDLAAGKGVLHFATHAIVSDADPFNSFLALAGSTTLEDDGTLTAQEIYGLKLQADVVVLSACRSGGGRVTGDGMATFARAFMYAGAPSLVTSVWDVADESSAHLIPGFYREWRRGASKAKALRNAQLAFLRNLRAGTVKVDTVAGPVVLPAHPALWAGFMLIGEPE